MHRTAPQCKVQFSYFDNSTNKANLHVTHIEDGLNQTIYSNVYFKTLENSNQWKTVQVGVGGRQLGKSFFITTLF